MVSGDGESVVLDGDPLSDVVHVMSARPGRIVHTRTVTIPRPRDLEVCFDPAFTDLVHELRGHIAAVRQ